MKITVLNKITQLTDLFFSLFILSHDLPFQHTQLESSLIELFNSEIKKESSLFEIESSLSELLGSLIQIWSSLVQ